MDFFNNYIPPVTILVSFKKYKEIFKMNNINKAINQEVINQETTNNETGPVRLSSPTLQENLLTLKAISELKFNWNGYEALPFTKTLIDKVEAILPSLSTQPFIFPTGRNSLQFEYHYVIFADSPDKKDEDHYLEFEVYEDKLCYLEVHNRNYSNAISQLYEYYDVTLLNNLLAEFKENCKK